MTIAQKMAGFAYALRLSDVPTEIARAARRHIADTLACALGAHGFAPVRALLDYARASRADGTARVVGYGDRTSPAMAALVNGAMVRYLDANDISSFGGGHFSDGVPPLLAVAQRRGASVDAFIEAVRDAVQRVPSMSRILSEVPRGVTDSRGIAFVEELRPGLPGVDAAKQWGILRDWIGVFFAHEFEVAPESFVTRLKAP